MVTTTTRARTRPGIAVHTTNRLPDGAVQTRHGMRVTSPERTLRDLPPPERERAVEQAHVLGLIVDAEHPAALTRSEAERRMLALIRAAGLPRPLVNTRLGPYEVDLHWPAERLVVEVDGYAFHSSRAAFERDRLRDADLQARGHRVLRITFRRIDEAPHAVVARLAAALATAAPAYATGRGVRAGRSRGAPSGTNRVATASRMPSTPKTTKNAEAVPSSENPSRNGIAISSAAIA